MVDHHLKTQADSMDNHIRINMSKKQTKKNEDKLRLFLSSQDLKKNVKNDKKENDTKSSHKKN